MSFSQRRRLAPLGPAPFIPGHHGLDARDETELLGTLGEAVRSASSSLARLRLGAWDDLRRAFPRPGQASAAASLVIASTTLASLGLFSAVVTTETETQAARSDGTTVELGLHPGLADLALAEVPVGVVPPPPEDPSAEPGPDGARVGESATGDGPTPNPVAGPAPPAGLMPAPVRFRVAPEVPGLSRIPRAAVPPPPSPPAVTPELSPDHPGIPALSRLSRTQLLAATPLPSPAVPEAGGVVPVVPTHAGALPLGKGMWLYVPEEVEGGSVEALVARAQQVGLTHVYVRTGSSKGGFSAQGYMDELLPKAHAAGIRVYGWDFPYLDDVDADVARAVAAITHTTPSGKRLDGFAADIETASEGTNLSAEGAGAYGQRLRDAVGPAYPLVVVVPRPSSLMQTRYPYAAVIPPFDAVAPMTYWLNRQPDSDVINDVSFLAPFGKPVLPIGQADDGAPEGGRPGPPPAEEIQRFLGAAQQVGAAGVSFWSWQHASPAIWDALQAAPEFRWEAKSPGELRADQVRALQAQLNRLGFPVPATGTWDDSTTGALRSYQERAGVPRTGILDTATLAVLMRPFNPPIQGLPPADGVALGLLRLGN
ncbi:hypothetical protein BH20ACT1_BH20ACT1_06600 [soil metagenome]